MAESVESMQHPEPLEVVELPVDALSPDEVNPNRVRESLMEAMRRDIEQHGFVVPVVVRPLKGDTYRIVDGEHRWRILKALGRETIPCVVDDVGETEGHMRLLTMNQLRGTFDPEKLRDEIVKLASKMDADELQERLGMVPEEYDSLLSLKGAGAEMDENLRKLLEREDKDAPEVLRFRLGPRQAKTVENVINQLTAAGKTKIEALIELLESGVEGK